MNDDILPHRKLNRMVAALSKRALREIEEAEAHQPEPEPGYCKCGNRLSQADTRGICLACQDFEFRINRGRR